MYTEISNYGLLGITSTQMIALTIMLSEPWNIPTKMLAKRMGIAPDSARSHIDALRRTFESRSPHAITDKWDMLKFAAQLGFQEVQILIL